MTGQNATHAAVLRLAVGEEIVICDGAAIDYHCTVVSSTKSETVAEFISKTPNIAEPNINITLYQALPKTGKMDEIVEKCTPLGVSHIVPIMVARCVTKISDRDAKKIARWQKIAQAVASQSQRGKVPQIHDVVTLEIALQQAKAHDAAFVCYEGEDRRSLKEFLQNMPQNLSSIAFFVGPEGGFADDEIMAFKKGRVATVSLGPRILRTELAGAVVLANLMYELEEAR